MRTELNVEVQVTFQSMAPMVRELAWFGEPLPPRPNRAQRRAAASANRTRFVENGPGFTRFVAPARDLSES